MECWPFVFGRQKGPPGVGTFCFWKAMLPTCGGRVQDTLPLREIFATGDGRGSDDLQLFGRQKSFPDSESSATQGIGLPAKFCNGCLVGNGEGPTLTQLLLSLTVWTEICKKPFLFLSTALQFRGQSGKLQEHCRQKKPALSFTTTLCSVIFCDLGDKSWRDCRKVECHSPAQYDTWTALRKLNGWSGMNKSPIHKTWPCMMKTIVLASIKQPQPKSTETLGWISAAPRINHIVCSLQCATVLLQCSSRQCRAISSQSDAIWGCLTAVWAWGKQETQRVYSRQSATWPSWWKRNRSGIPNSIRQQTRRPTPKKRGVLWGSQFLRFSFHRSVGQFSHLNHGAGGKLNCTNKKAIAQKVRGLTSFTRTIFWPFQKILKISILS